MRKKNESIIHRLKPELRDPEILKRVRVQATDLTRERGVTWPVVSMGMVRGQKVSVPNAVNNFFTASGEGWRVVTAGA